MSYAGIVKFDNLTLESNYMELYSGGSLFLFIVQELEINNLQMVNSTVTGQKGRGGIELFQVLNVKIMNSYFGNN